MRVRILLIVMLAVTVAACDDDGDGTFTPSDLFRELSSPENVLHNIATCHNEMDYGHFVPIIHDQFTFSFDDDDVVYYYDVIPGGVLYKLGFLETMHKMLDEKWVPCDTLTKIKDMEMVLQLSGALIPSNLEGAPQGTLMARANLHLEIDTAGGAWYSARSRPLFFFAPDSSRAATDGVTWQIWRVEDLPLTSPLLYASPDAYPQGTASGLWSGAVSGGNSSGGAEITTFSPLPVEEPTWGLILVLYSRTCD